MSATDPRVAAAQSLLARYYAAHLQTETVQRIIAEADRAAREAAHPDDLAVDRLAVAMKAKLEEKRLQGYEGWDKPDRTSVEFLADALVEHVEKGDPVDVANFAMMLRERGVTGNSAVLRQALQRGTWL